MRTFTISQKKWLRGEGTPKSFLLRPGDGKMCCIGQLAEQCEVPKDELLNEKDLCSISGCYRHAFPKKLMEEALVWDMYCVNDEPSISDTWRKTQLRRLAKKAGFRFKFVK